MRKTILFLATTVLLSGCGKKLPPVPEPDTRPAKLFTVSIGNTQFERTFPATTEAGDKAELAFRVPGQLLSIDVVAGQPVLKGDVLATLDPDEYALLMKQAEAQYRLADVQYQRAKRLLKDAVVSEQDYDDANANRKSAKATLDQANANLSYTRLVAPYDGTISLVPAEEHEFIAAQVGVMNIQTTQLIKVIFQLPDHLLNRFASGFNVTSSMRFDAFPDEQYEVMFQEIDTEADPKTASYKVTMVMEMPEDVGILPGMAGSIVVRMESGGATSIPQSALINENGQTFVWRVDSQGVVEKAEIQLNEKQQVQSGLNEGEQIIVSGVNGIEPGIKVREWIKERGL